jgi:serine/threonine protein kinase
MLNLEGVAKLCDMGFSGSGDHKTITRTMNGIQDYLSPEAWFLKGYNPKSDVWAVGICLLQFMKCQFLSPMGDVHEAVKALFPNKVDLKTLKDKTDEQLRMISETMEWTKEEVNAIKTLMGLRVDDPSEKRDLFDIVCDYFREDFVLVEADRAAVGYYLLWHLGSDFCVKAILPSPFFSDECVQFFVDILDYDVETRPNAEELLQHPFITKYIGTTPTVQDRLKSWVSRIEPSKEREYKEREENCVNVMGL